MVKFSIISCDNFFTSGSAFCPSSFVLWPSGFKIAGSDFNGRIFSFMYAAEAILIEFEVVSLDDFEVLHLRAVLLVYYTS